MLYRVPICRYVAGHTSLAAAPVVSWLRPRDRGTGKQGCGRLMLRHYENIYEYISSVLVLLMRMQIHRSARDGSAVELQTTYWVGVCDTIRNASIYVFKGRLY